MYTCCQNKFMYLCISAAGNHMSDCFCYVNGFNHFRLMEDSRFLSYTYYNFMHGLVSAKQKVLLPTIVDKKVF